MPILIFLAFIVVILVPIVYLRSRRLTRERKNYERGLKMVPLLIHLPPPSEDTESNGRDIRDVTEETISKAQIVYGIIASTFQKGWKYRLYGQRHFAFEIIGSQGFVHFYAAVPVGLTEVVKQAIVSAYPSARLEEVAEHNIFSPIGKITGTVGGELALKEPFAYPIATFQDLKRDAMQALLNSLANLSKGDGVGIQLLLRPADPSWRKTAHVLASKKRKGKDEKTIGAKLLNWLRLFATAIVKAPEEAASKSTDKELSDLDQSIINSIDEKTRHPGYEVLIRIVVSSNISQRSQAILGNIVAAFALFDAPGKNGFRYTPAKDVEKLATAYILRLFPQQSKGTILNSIELSTIFHFPDQRSIPTSQLERQDSKQVDGPRNVSDHGLLLGYNLFRGVKKPIRLADIDRQRHMYVVGQTGTGKSTFLEDLALQDMMNNNGFAFVDPHGDSAERLLAMVPRERTEDVIYFCPADMDYPMGLNLFEFETPDQKDFLIQEALAMLYKLYDPQHSGIMGPRYEHLFRNAALTIMADPEGGTFIDIPKLFRDTNYVKQKLQHVHDPSVLEFWQKEMPQSQRSNEFGEVVSWFVSKFGAFLSNGMMRNIIGQTESSFNLREIMDNGKILLVNLSKGRTGQLNTQLLGMIFVMKFQAAAMSRANIRDEAQRRDFCLYVDEFQNFSTDSFATILSEARKYHLNLIVANQYTRQLSDEIRDAVFGNVGTLVSFRVGNDDDADVLAKRMQPAFSASDLLRMPNFNAAVRTMIGGVPTQPFSLATLPPLGTPNPKLASALKQLSAAKYGHPKAAVETAIFKRMETKPLSPSQSGFSPGGLGALPPTPSSAWPATQGGHTVDPGLFSTQPMGTSPVMQPATKPGVAPPSFLDEWLVKRSVPARPLANPFTAQTRPTTSTFSPQKVTQKSTHMPALTAKNNAMPGRQASATLQPPQSQNDADPGWKAYSTMPGSFSESKRAESDSGVDRASLSSGDTIQIDQKGSA